MEKQIVNIAANGDYTIEVQGVKGAGCMDVTKSLERALGKTVSSTKTREFNEKVRTNANATASN